MSEITEKGYKGSICFARNTEYGHIAVFDGDPETFNEYWEGKYLLVGSCEVDVQFNIDTRGAEIEALEKKREELRGKMAAAIAQIDGRIESLRALPNMAEVDA